MPRTILGALAAALALAGGLAAARAGDTPPEAWLKSWPNTDFSRALVGFDEIESGGPPRDGIPAIDAPRFAGAAGHEGLDPREPVMVVPIPGQPPRAYPLRYLIWHEIVNDEIGGVPVAVTYCPLCNAAVAFDRRLDGRVLTFGVTGKLRNSDLVMFDRETESWWQQFGGEGIVGELAGRRLTALLSWMEAWDAFRRDHPGGLVMLKPENHERPYGRNPYVGYDGSHWPFMYRGETPPHDIHPLARVVHVGDRAWPLERLAEAGELEEDGLRLVWSAGQASAVDAAEIGEGRDVGGVKVFDAETGEPLVHSVVFAFVFHAFEPEGRWMIGG